MKYLLFVCITHYWYVILTISVHCLLSVYTSSSEEPGKIHQWLVHVYRRTRRLWSKTVYTYVYACITMNAILTIACMCLEFSSCRFIRATSWETHVFSTSSMPDSHRLPFLGVLVNQGPQEKWYFILTSRYLRRLDFPYRIVSAPLGWKFEQWLDFKTSDRDV